MAAAGRLGHDTAPSEELGWVEAHRYSGYLRESLDADESSAGEQWERDHQRGFFYAGVQKGANVASWIQASLLEHAGLTKLQCAASFVDMVKCFERVTHVALLEEAKYWHYPLWILRMCMLAYKFGRRISIKGVVSRLVFALRGITAGSVTATTELRLLLLRTLDDVARRFRHVPMHVYIDDMFQFLASTMSIVVSQFPKAVEALM